MENGKNRLQQVQDDAEEVKGIMLENLQKVEDRSGKLRELEDRADQLLVQSKAFQKTTATVKRRACLQAMKMRLLLGGLVAVLLVIVIVVIIILTVPSSKTNNTDPTNDGRR
ncbi:vesicle-associated membrane protein 5 [Brienomyrus brachyistius]|uniref:vesicle-associated membrane protein 5 n=1 Tax=Brienomyrus brachyistius TaxID=42636 RepID=UPI0020B38829|nr:vesicle-associated membrane protein 5 [Brienomyrus brachyistius]